MLRLLKLTFDGVALKNDATQSWLSHCARFKYLDRKGWLLFFLDVFVVFILSKSCMKV